MEKSNNLQLVKQGYVGLQDAQKQVSKLLRKVTQYSPAQINIHQSDVEQVITLIGNGMITTISTQPLAKGGAR